MKKQASRTLYHGVLRCLMVVAVAASITALATNKVVSDDKKQPGGEEQEKEMKAKWAAAGKPGEFHKKLDRFVGEWKAVSKFWMDPSQAPETSEGTMKTTWILGDRFLKDEYKGEAMGEPFEGMGLWGYDNLKKKYVSTWADTMSTSIMMDFGTCDASGKTFTFSGSHDHPITGKTVETKTVLRVVNRDKHIMEMYEPGPDGKLFKNLEIVYTRK